MSHLVDAILDKTRVGKVTSWNDRIATIANAARLPMDDIDWDGSPREVAERVVECAIRHDSHHSLSEVLSHAHEFNDEYQAR